MFLRETPVSDSKDKLGAQLASEKFFAGRVGERLKPADCKSAAPCGLRRFESFPVHQVPAVGIAENRRASLRQAGNRR